ncbi:hypothetical protein D3C75_772220 [compost metagenome]
MDMVARKKPMNADPDSPIKILAGSKLKNRKPTRLPSKTLHSSTTGKLPVINAIIIVVTNAMALTPLANPSKPSIQFTALITPIIQNIVNGMEIHNGKNTSFPKGVWI